MDESVIDREKPVSLTACKSYPLHDAQYYWEEFGIPTPISGDPAATTTQGEN